MNPSGTSPSYNSDDWVIVGQRWYEEPWWYRWGLTDFGSGFFSLPNIEYTAETDAFITPVANDEDSIDIDINFERPLSNVEKNAVEELKRAIIHDKDVINSLPSGQQIRMYDGSIITKEELLTRYQRADIRIDDNNYSWDEVHQGYKNGSDRGESIYHSNGDVELHFEIHKIVSYYLQAGGLNFMLAHELGHTTPQGQALNGGPDQETYANDVAWAMALWSNSTRYEAFSGSHYSDTAPVFLNGGGGPIIRDPTCRIRIKTPLR